MQEGERVAWETGGRRSERYSRTCGDGVQGLARGLVRTSVRDVIAEQPAPAPHLAHPEGCATLRIVLVPVPRVSRSCEHSLDGFDLHLLHWRESKASGSLQPCAEKLTTPEFHPDEYL